MQTDIKYPVKSRLERIRIFEANAFKILDDHEYDHFLSHEEIAETEHDYAQNAIALQKLVDAKKQAMEELNEKIKEQTEECKTMLEKINTGRVRVTERCFIIQDDHTGNLCTYNADGLLLSEMPARAGMQRNLKFNGGDGTEGNPFEFQETGT